MKAPHPDDRGLFQLAVQHSPIAMGLTDPDGHYRVVNDALVQMLGRDRSELLRTTWQSVTHPDDLAESLATHQRLLDGECDHYRLSKRVRHADGRVIWIDLTVSAIRESGGPIRAALFQAVDVTAMVESRQRAEAERERLQATLDSLLDPHVVIRAVRDPHGTVVDFRYVDANAMACQAVGVPREKLLGARVLPLVPALHDPALFARYVHTLESGEPLVSDNLIAAEGMGLPPRHYDLRVVRQADTLVVTWRDVSKRNEMEELVDLLTRSSGELVVRLDLDGVIRWVSPSLPSLLGWQSEEWLGRRGTEFLEHGGHCPGYQASHQRLLAGESRVCRERIRARDGSLHWLESYITPQCNARGAVVGLALVCRLIDDRMAIREALKRKLRTSLSAASIAHEIKKPLSLLLMHSEQAQRQIEIAPGAPKLLGALMGLIQHEARTVVNTIERMNALLRSVPTEPEPVDLGTVVRSSLLYQRPQLLRRGIELETAGLENPWPIHGDGGQLQIALNNLIENARDALIDPPVPKARLRVSLQRQEGSVLLTVEDNGPGFSDLADEHLPLNTTKPSGTGLGIYLVEQICGNHDGQLELGRSPLGGAAVRMRFPLDLSLPVSP